MKLLNEETNILAKLDSPYIVSFIEVFEDDNCLYIVMEYLDQVRELQSLIKERKAEKDKDPTRDFESILSTDEVRSLM